MRNIIKLEVFLISLTLLSTILSSILPSIHLVNNMKDKLILSDHDDIFGEIYVLRPTDSDVLVIGQNFSIRWSYKGSIEYVTIALYKDYVFTDSIVITTVNDGEYIWLIKDYEESNNYLIGIWDYNDFNNIDFSDRFTIALQISPNIDNLPIYLIFGSFIGMSILCLTLLISKLRRSKK